MTKQVPHGRRQQLPFDRPAAVALGLGLLGVGYRLVLVLLTVPGSNSDEATFGLAALHIATGRERPVFLYGQHYMGTVESYLAAPFFALLGPGWVPLRLPLVLLYGVFLYLIHRLTRRLYSPWCATFTVGLLALGSERVIRDQMTAVGGRPEIKPAVVLLLLIAVASAQHRLRRGWQTMALFGLVAGLATWDDWLVLPYLAAAVGILLVGRWRELLGRGGSLMVLGFAIGLLPLLVDNLHAPPEQDSISVLKQVSGEDGATAPAAQTAHGTVLVSIPLATGLCPPQGCDPWQFSWGVCYLALLLGAAGLALRGLRRGWSDPVRRGRHAGQLALLVAAGLTLASYARSPLAASTPDTSARYLSVLQISLPAVIWPAWLAVRRGWAGAGGVPPVPRRARVAGAAVAVGLVALVGSLVFGTAALVRQIGPVRAEERQARELADTLRRAGIRDVYGEYWTCNRLTFLAGEEVVCAVLSADLRPGQDRYLPYRRRVHRADRPAFVFAAGGPADTAFQDHLRQAGVSAARSEVGRYRIYRPSVTVRPWR